MALPVHLAMKLVDELGHEVGRHQLVLQGIQDHALEHAAANAAAVLACPSAARLAAGKVVGADRCQGAAADAAEGLFGQQMPRPPMLPEPGGSGVPDPLTVADAAQALPDGFPERLLDYPQMRYVLDQPLGRRV